MAREAVPLDLNAQRIGKFDQDFRFGSEGVRDAFYTVKLLEDADWDGHAPLRRPPVPHRGRGRRLGLRARVHAHLPDPGREGPPLPDDPEIQEALAAARRTAWRADAARRPTAAAWPRSGRKRSTSTRWRRRATARAPRPTRHRTPARRPVMRRLLSSLALVALVALVAPFGGAPSGALALSAPGMHRWLPLPCPPFVIAHRGASGYRPEHALAAYELAIDMGADYVEPDLVMTADGRLVARHDNVLDLTTDVASRRSSPPSARRRWSTGHDHRLVQRGLHPCGDQTAPGDRAHPRRPPRQRRVRRPVRDPDVHEILDLVRRKEREQGRRIGIYPETKHPTYFAARPRHDAAARHASRHGTGTQRSDPSSSSPSRSPTCVGSHDDRLPLVQLLGFGIPPDVAAAVARRPTSRWARRRSGRDRPLRRRGGAGQEPR